MNPTKSNDTKFVLGAVTGGTASLVGHSATALVGKALTIKFAGTAAIKTGAALAMCNPVVCAVMLVGGAAYLAYKADKEG